MMTSLNPIRFCGNSQASMLFIHQSEQLAMILEFQMNLVKGIKDLKCWVDEALSILTMHALEVSQTIQEEAKKDESDPGALVAKREDDRLPKAEQLLKFCQAGLAGYLELSDIGSADSDYSAWLFIKEVLKGLLESKNPDPDKKEVIDRLDAYLSDNFSSYAQFIRLQARAQASVSSLDAALKGEGSRSESGNQQSNNALSIATQFYTRAESLSQRILRRA